MQSNATTVDEYVRSLPRDRREAIEIIRAVFRKNIDEGFEEGMGYGMPGYYVPHSIYPAGYHCNPKQPLPFAGFASQKNAISVYFFCLYCDEAAMKRFVDEWKKTGKKLDMGKSCIRAKSIDGFALDVIGDTLKRVKLNDFIRAYEAGLKQAQASKARRSAVRKKATTTKKPAAKAKASPAASRR